MTTPGDTRVREGACPHCKRPLTPMQFHEVGGWKPVPTVNATDGYPDRCAGPLPDGGGYALACWGEVEWWKARALKAEENYAVLSRAAIAVTKERDAAEAKIREMAAQIDALTIQNRRTQESLHKAEKALSEKRRANKELLQRAHTAEARAMALTNADATTAEMQDEIVKLRRERRAAGAGLARLSAENAALTAAALAVTKERDALLEHIRTAREWSYCDGPICLCGGDEHDPHGHVDKCPVSAALTGS